MKYLFVIYVLTMFFACAPRPKGDNANNNHSLTDSSLGITPPTKADTTNLESNNSNKFQASTYDNPQFATKLTSQKESLQRLSDKGVFTSINNKLVSILVANQKEYFKAKPDIKLLAIAKGDLFQNNKDDYAFVVYDTRNQSISILTFNAQTKKYLKLFRELKIENGLESADCNYGAFGTLDYQLADEIVYQEESLTKNPESYLESTPCKITDLSKDSDFVLKSGCFSKKISKTNLSNSLCISTSSVYNNWECLKYEKATKTFLIYYGQAFAD